MTLLTSFDFAQLGSIPTELLVLHTRHEFSREREKSSDVEIWEELPCGERRTSGEDQAQLQGLFVLVVFWSFFATSFPFETMKQPYIAWGYLFIRTSTDVIFFCVFRPYVLQKKHLTGPRRSKSEEPLTLGSRHVLADVYVTALMPRASEFCGEISIGSVGHPESLVCLGTFWFEFAFRFTCLGRSFWVTFLGISWCFHSGFSRFPLCIFWKAKEFCRKPCIYNFYEGCRNDSCTYCHLPHHPELAKFKFDKRQKEILQGMTESQLMRHVPHGCKIGWSPFYYVFVYGQSLL